MSEGNYVGEIRYRGLRFKDISWTSLEDEEGKWVLEVGGVVEKGDKGYWRYTFVGGEEVEIEEIEIREVGSSEYKKLVSVIEKYEEFDGLMKQGYVAEACPDIIMGLKGTGIRVYDRVIDKKYGGRSFIPSEYLGVEMVEYEDKESFLQSRYYTIYNYTIKDMRKLGNGVLELLDMLRGVFDMWVVDKEVVGDNLVEGLVWRKYDGLEVLCGVSDLVFKSFKG